ncbi:DNA-binding transcriptional regulator OxyR (plasmid) [Novosphingobium sp. THN1]|uniref:hydrogen peroxide-inducible genes activator n=1 Tax=unclassified Novosphingobium TaxID=2644732 RepID=UPI000E4D69D9|nr:MULTISPECIES: hydrogen peroxide-inducible genes activator [unclassified Novosphingobium]AXU20987.1 DNA-binding transcriptional regulator OxyR [Novosphingobium sp. THN1]NLR40295.1 hydrogen peroxide-inducible genes activator [Novosphingobium sp. ERW19]
MLSFRQLQYLVAIADYQHFRRAAANLHVSQPTLSLQVQKMEEHLGVALVERGVTPVRLTPVGREIVARARRLLLDMTDLEDCARRSAGKLIGTISLGVSPTIGPYLLPGIIGVLKQQMPQVRLHIREGVPSEHLLELRHGALDIMLTPIPAAGADLHVEKLFEERLQVVAPPEHPLSGRRSVIRADLAGSEALGIDPRYPFHQQTQEICEDLGLTLLTDYEGTSLDSLCQMCASGLGLAVLPELYLRSEVGGRNVVTPLAIKDWAAKRSIAAVWRAGSVYTESFHEIALAIQREAQLLLAEARPGPKAVRTGSSGVSP